MQPYKHLNERGCMISKDISLRDIQDKNTYSEMFYSSSVSQAWDIRLFSDAGFQFAHSAIIVDTCGESPFKASAPLTSSAKLNEQNLFLLNH